MTTFNETTINILSEGSRIEGHVVFDHISRIHGTLIGEVRAKEGSTLILSQTAVVEGNIEADVLIIDGFIRGNVFAKTRVVISRTGRIMGNIKTRSLILEFGAYFDGRCNMESLAPISSPTPKPA